METLSCQKCPHNHFCCTFKVKLTPLELLKIRLRGHKDFYEKSPKNQNKNKITIKLTNGYCYFFKGHSCQIYNIRPKPCRQFPSLITFPNCTNFYHPWKKHQDKLKKLLK